MRCELVYLDRLKINVSFNDGEGQLFSGKQVLCVNSTPLPLIGLLLSPEQRQRQLIIENKANLYFRILAEDREGGIVKALRLQRDKINWEAF
jgi:hypothetical protein